MLLNCLVCRNSVRTSQETHYISATKTNRLMLFEETVADFFELYGTQGLLDVKVGGTYSNHSTLEG
jgi:hypothetical protein